MELKTIYALEEGVYQPLKHNREIEDYDNNFYRRKYFLARRS